MAIHSGTAESRGDDWFGPPLNRVSRMLDAGHGGQILLSQAAERLVADRFPEGTALVDLGERTLKDLARPERIFQLVTQDLPADFPPLRSLDARPHNLPVSPTPLIGREDEITALRSMFLRDRVRLVSLVGPGGTGKTRLALHVAAELIDAFRDGVFLVNFAPVQDAALVPAEILQVLGEKPEDDLAPADALRQVLRGRETLLVLDNFEQLVAAAPFAAELLREAPGLSLLVTSQAALHVQGEHEFPVPPLEVPDDGAAADPERLMACDAVALFVQRARATMPAFDLTRENGQAVATIVRQLDGLPLAIELAAARIKLFPPDALVARLSRMFDFLTGGARDLPDRHRTLRAAIEWSYALLSEEDRALFHRQSVFDGGFTLEAAEAVCSAPGAEIDVLAGVESLLDKSLLRQTRTSGTEPRFERLRTIRAFAVEKLEASGEADVWRRRHAEWFAAFAELYAISAAPTETREHLARLRQEQDNLRAAFAWSVDGGEATLAVRLCAVLNSFWFVTGSTDEGERWLERLLAMGSKLGPRERAQALVLRGRLAQVRGDNSPAVVADFEESLAHFRALGDQAGEARAMMSLGNVHRRRGEDELAESLFENSLAIYRRLGDLGEGGALLNLADLNIARGETARARLLLEQAATIARRAENSIGLGYVLGYMGTAAYREGALDEAEDRFRKSLELFREVGGGEISQAWMIAGLGSVARERGDLGPARQLFLEALALFQQHDYRPGMAHALVSLAAVEALEDRAERAAHLLGAGETLRLEAAISSTPSEAIATQIVLERGRRELGEEAFERARAVGAEFSLDRSLALARSAAG